MTAASPVETGGSPASRVLGRKMDSIPFGFYQVLIIGILALIGFIEGYDLFMTGSLLVLAKAPLHLTGSDIQWLILGPAIMGMIGGLGFSAVGDRLSRKAMLLIGVIATTFLTLLVPLVQNGEQLIILRSLTGLGAGGVWSAVFPIAAELMPAQHRRTYGAVYEMALASSFTVLPFFASLLSGNEAAFRWLALPGGLALLVVPPIVYFLLPESPRWHLRRGEAQIAVDVVNRIIRRSGNRVTPLTVTELGDVRATARETLPPYWALFAKGQLRWTVVGVIAGTCAGCASFSIATLLPKALTNQGYAVALSLEITSVIYLTSFFGKAFAGWLMEIIGRRWTICFVMAGSLPGFWLMLLAHRAGPYAHAVMIAGGLITGFTVVSAFSATRVYLSEQFPTALRGRGHIFGESIGKIVAGGLVPFFLAPNTGSPAIYFGTLAVVVALGAFVPIVWGKETVGQLEAVAEEVPVLA
ncbi:MAG TPA: MFS transporter [Stellaceae bacterium]|nr:MFS transporter [Stellaceae bacterium]